MELINNSSYILLGVRELLVIVLYSMYVIPRDSEVNILKFK